MVDARADWRILFPAACRPAQLILASVLTALYESVSILLRDNVEKMNLFDKYAQVLLIVDELVDGGIIMETDATVLSKAAEGGGQSGGTHRAVLVLLPAVVPVVCTLALPPRNRTMD